MSATTASTWQAMPRTRELRKVRNAVSKTPGKVLRARLRQVLSINVHEEARWIRVPVLSIKTTNDRLVPPRTYEQLPRCVPQSREIDGPHFILQVKRAECAKAVEKFIHVGRSKSAETSSVRVRQYP